MKKLMDILPINNRNENNETLIRSGDSDLGIIQRAATDQRTPDLSGEFQAKSRVPSIRFTASNFNVNMNTVVRAPDPICRRIGGNIRCA